LNIADIDTSSTIITERAGHCFDIIKDHSLEDIDAIVTVGGDGILSELLNGIMSRDDWRFVLSKPISVIPCGTGNALATSLKSPNWLAATMNIIHGLETKIDLMGFYQPTVENEETSKWKVVTFGFEALMFGLVSDIDFESESMRYLGSSRYTIGALKRIAALRRYPAKILYLESDVSPKINNCEIDEIIENDEDDDNSTKKTKFSIKGLPKSLKSSIKFYPSEENLMKKKWKRIELDIAYFVASNITHIATDIKSTPYAKFNDGYIDIVFTNNNTSRREILKFFSGQLESGKYVNNDSISYIKTKSYILIPTGKRSLINIDGEKFECKPTLVENFKDLMTVYHPNWDQTI